MIRSGVLVNPMVARWFCDAGRVRTSVIDLSADTTPETELSALCGKSRRGFLNSGAGAALAQPTDLERDRTGVRQLGLRR